MFFDKLLKPLVKTFSGNPLQSRNTETRKKAVQALPVSDQQSLNAIALNDPDNAIRIIAANKISDLNNLQTIIMKGTNEPVKQAAQQRMHQLLCALKHPIPPLAERQKIVSGSRNPALLEFVAEHADKASLREAAIKKINRDPLLGNIALNDKNAQVRQLAAQQIAKRSTLDRVAKKSRRTDKRVYKIVKTKLDTIIEDEQRPALLAKEVVDICDKLEKLHKRNLLLQEKTTFENYLTRWNDIENFANKDITERFYSICTAISGDIYELEEHQQQQKEAQLNLDSLLSNLSQAVDELLNIEANDKSAQELTDSRQKMIANLQQEWDVIIDSIHDKELITSYNAKFQAILNLTDVNNEPAVNNNNRQSIEHIIEQAENMLHKSGLILEKTIAALQQRFNHQIAANNLSIDDAEQLHSRFETIIDSLNKQLEVQQQQAKNLKDKLAKTTHKVKTLLTEGHVSKAEHLLHDEIKLIKKSSIISAIEKQKHQDELKQLQAQLGDLSSWRNWAHDKERENLISKAEQLVTQVKESSTLEQDYPEVTAAVKELRQQWKKMRSHTPEEFWQQFNNTCNQAYEQCVPFIDKQTELRQNNLKAKQAVCQQLEDYIAAMHWPSAESDAVNHKQHWIQVDKITRQARKEWSAIGFVERKDHKAINKRFDKAVETIRHELKKVWQHNQEQFYKLIDQVEALHETLDEDLSGAINKVKDYQKQWKTIGPVSSYQRNKLWKKFRKGCDIIFAKRQEGIDKKNDMNTEKLREKEVICENLEALNQQPLKQADLENAYKDIETLWNELKPQAKALSKEVNKRYTRAVKDYQNKVQELIAEQKKINLELLQQKAALCTQIEQLSECDDDTVQKFNEQWSDLAQQHSDSSTLKQRFNQALQAVSADKETLIESELNNKHDFCLTQEILLCKDSPEKDQQARMKKQVELLNSNLGNNTSEENSNDSLSTYEFYVQWYELGNYSQDKELEQRFFKLLA